MIPTSRGRIVRWSVSLSASSLALLVLAWVLAPYLVADPLPALEAHTPTVLHTDARGELVWAERTYEGEWRFPVKLEEVSPEVVRFLLGAEDSRFYQHHGVDYLAVLRAFRQNLLHGRVVSGASTISMQVAGLAHGTPQHTLWGKFVQAAEARRLERSHTKREILEAYLNHLPYGGKLYGIEAASRRYFGKSAREIGVLEASVLAGIPQAPNRYRPDRFPARARARQHRVLLQLVRRGRMTEPEAAALEAEGAAAYGDFGVPTDFERRGEAREALHMLPYLATLDAALTRSVRQTLVNQLSGVAGVADGAAVVRAAKTGAVLAYVGTLDWNRAGDGQVDAAAAVRSAGSVLKPFIYQEALEGGLITPETVLLDAPVRYGGYAPGNYDGTYHGRVTATTALAQSLNTPAVRLVAQLGEARTRAAFQRAGLESAVVTNGLSLALGSAGYTLRDITRAYCTLATNATISSMLRYRPLPGTELDAAWKTGTSNNHCDAWCVAYTPDYVVGVWYGNKSGRRAAALVGADLAAPAAAEILTHLCRNRSPVWPQAPERTPRSVAPELPRPAAILSPAPGTYAPSFGAASVRLPLKGSCAGMWYVDGVFVGAPEAFDFAAGRHEVVLVPERGAAATVRLGVAEAL